MIMQQYYGCRIVLQGIAEHIPGLGQAGIDCPYRQSLDAQELVFRRKVYGSKPFLRQKAHVFHNVFSDDLGRTEIGIIAAYPAADDAPAELYSRTESDGFIRADTADTA